jgi:ATP-binding cassette, subfamily F, member 3
VISVQGVCKTLAHVDIFREVSFHIGDGERVGLIGRNGVGKTTLLRMLLGEVEPDAGVISKPKRITFGFLPQQLSQLTGSTVLAYVMDVSEQLTHARNSLQDLETALNTAKDGKQIKNLALKQAHLIEKFELLGGYDLEARARTVLAGLGFADKNLLQPVASLSGGWLMRLALARLLLAAPDLLLLDEPTNHLDLDSLIWLEQYLLSSNAAMIIISHDRVFLNRVVERILELENGRLQEFAGNYDTYLEEKARRQEIQLASFKNQQDRIRQIERFISRNRYRKDRARQVQSRLKLLDKIDLFEAPEDSLSVSFSFPDSPRSGKRVMELCAVHKIYGDRLVYAGIDLLIERGDRIAFLGPNGAGKSTLLKILAGIEDVSGGTRHVGHQVVIGYYAQHQMEQLGPELTVLQEVLQVAGDLTQTQLRGLLGAFLFRGEDVEKRVSVLSGGERARLALCKLLLQRPNLLLLDEPTNHLDIPSREVFEEALETFSGTICFISHDRHLINAIASKILLIESNRVQMFPGNYEDYVRVWQPRLEGLPEGEMPAGTSPVKKDPALAPFRESDRKRMEAQWRNEFYRLKKPLQEQQQELETAIEQAHARLESLNAILADPGTYLDGSNVQQHQKEYQALRKKIETLTEQWEEKALSLEELEQSFWQDKQRKTDLDS